MIEAEQQTMPRQGRPGRRPEPTPASELSHLTLDELRAYRSELGAEETRVSYWRRVVQARLDTAAGASAASAPRLQDVLASHRAESDRLARVAVHPTTARHPLPPLPDLAALWDLEVASGEDADGSVGTGSGSARRDELMRRLADAERELSAYRRGLHERLDRATGELIWRYRVDPATALSALPRSSGGHATVA